MAKSQIILMPIYELSVQDRPKATGLVLSKLSNVKSDQCLNGWPLKNTEYY